MKKKAKLGRPPLGKRAMTDAERMRRYRARLPKAKGRDPLDRYEDLLEELRGLCTLFPAEMVLFEFRGLIDRVMKAEEERVKAGKPVEYPVNFIAGSLR